MSRLPPALLYLAIYNPTLQPAGPAADAEADEDAEEQAQILFYTAREHAVSRDKMLRQVGLAKALISFADMFAAEDACENVHSQSRRMVMVSPEPGFWIHACVELARTLRQSLQPGKGKGDKDKSKDKGKAKAKEPSEVIYDYHDGSVNNWALRAHLLRAYELFVLTHGTFASILSTLGQQALELQLERFFTPWAWNWDVERDGEFSGYLGVPLHPLQQSIRPLLDGFLSEASLPPDACPFLLVPPHMIPSTSYTAHRMPSALSAYLRPRVPPRPPPSRSATPPSELATLTANAPSAAEPARVGAAAAEALVDGTRGALNATGSAFIAVGSAMDVRKWSWPTSLTFGKKGTDTPPLLPGTGTTSLPGASVPVTAAAPQESGAEEAAEETKDADKSAESGPGSVSDSPPTMPEVKFDQESLFDAMSSLGVAPQGDEQPSGPPSDLGSDAGANDARSDALTAQGEGSMPNSASGEASGDREPHEPEKPEESLDEELGSPDAEAPHDDDDAQEATLPPDVEVESPAPAPPSPIVSPPSPEPLPPLSRLRLHLPGPEDPDATARRDVLYMAHDGLALAFVVPADAEPDANADSVRLSRVCFDLLVQAQAALDEGPSSEPSTPLYSATKILQPRDRFVVARAGATITSPDFASRAEHLFAARDLISNADVFEVYSRTQGPQHWHVARRERSSAIFMEVMRKETSLTDVDNELLGVLRRYRDDA